MPNLPQNPPLKRQQSLPLATLIARELRAVNGISGKADKPFVKFGVEAFAKRGEDLYLHKLDCFRIPGNPSSCFSVFAVFDGHNGVSAAVFTRQHLLEHVMKSLPRGIGREEWLELLPSALVAGFVKTDIDFQRQGETSGTTATLVVIDGLTVTVASVGDSRCILETPGGGSLCLLTVDHRLEENVEERERVTASGGEVGRLNLCGGREIGPLRCWPGGLCLSRSIGDTDVGEYIVPVPHVKQVKLSSAGGRLIIASDGIWDALSSDMVAKVCRGTPAELAAKLVVKEALRTTGLKDDTTCIVVDIIPFNQPSSPLYSTKQQSKLMSLLFGRKSQNGRRNKLSSVGAVEELFEEGSAMLEERLGKAFLSKANSDPLRCALCQVNQAPEDLSADIDACYSPMSNPWEGAYLCNECRRKKDAMEGKWHRESRMSR